jgi:hypothetical protein
MSLGGLADLALGIAAGKQATNDTGGAFTIFELTGKKRQIRLTGRALPYQPFELTTSMRLTTTWLPGYAEATATLLGAKEEPTTINGYWKDKYVGPDPASQAPGDLLGQAAAGLQSVSSSLTGGFGPKSSGGSAIELDGSAVKSVFDAAEKIDGILREGQLLQVAWGGQVRRGHMISFKKIWHNTKDLEWEMQFEWTSRGEPTGPSGFANDATAAGAKDLLNKALDDIVAILAELPAISSELQDLVTSQMQKIVSLVQQLGDAVQAVADIASLPGDSARRAASTLQAIGGIAQDTVEQIDNRPAMGWAAGAQPATRVGGTKSFLEARDSGLETEQGGIESLSTADRMTIQDFVSRMRQGLRSMRATAADKAAQLAKQSHGDILGVFTAQDGDDLRDAAFQFYGDAFDWRRLLFYNNLSSSELVPGQLLPRHECQLRAALR